MMLSTRSLGSLPFPITCLASRISMPTSFSPLPKSKLISSLSWTVRHSWCPSTNWMYIASTSESYVIFIVYPLEEKRINCHNDDAISLFGNNWCDLLHRIITAAPKAIVLEVQPAQESTFVGRLAHATNHGLAHFVFVRPARTTAPQGVLAQADRLHRRYYLP